MKKKIKICIIDEDGRYGGPQNRMIQIASSLKKNFNFFFLIPKSDTDYFAKILKKKKLDYKKINLTRLTLEKKILIKYIFNFFYEIFLLIKIFKEKKFDKIQINSTPHFKAAIACIILNIRPLWVIEDSYSNILVKYLFIFIARLSNSKIIFTSNNVKKFYLGKLLKNNKKYFIPAPVDYKIFNRHIKVKKPNFIKKDKIIISMIASMLPVKGILEYLDIVKEITSTNKNIQFILCGPKLKNQEDYVNKIFNKIKNLKTKNFYYLFRMIDSRKILKFTDFFICTSKSEGGPLTCCEAILMNVPVVTTNVGLMPQVIKQGVNGYVINNYDMQKFQKKLSFLLKSFPKKRYLKINNNKNYIFELQNVAKKYNRLYRDKNE